VPGRKIALAALLVAALAGPAEAGRVFFARKTKCKADRAPKPAKSLRTVDWCNRDYLGKQISLLGGHGELHEYAELGGPHDTHLSSLQSVAWLDVDGDGTAEALVALTRDDWFVGEDGESRNHSRSQIYVYGWKDGGLALLGTMDAATPIHAVAVSKGNVAVRSGKTPQSADALSRFRLTPDGFEPR
jgi:hypothetical protein